MAQDYSLYFYMAMPDTDFPVHIFQNHHLEPGPFLKNHWHEHLQFLYFTQGQALLHCNSNPIHVIAEDVVIINSNELHYGENLGHDLAYYVVRIDFSFLFSHQMDSCQTKYMIPLAQNLILFKNKISKDQNIRECLDKMINEYYTHKIGFELAVKSYTYNLLVLLLRGYIEKIFNEQAYNLRVINLKRFQNILTYIENHYTGDLSISHLADLVNISCPHFCRLFKQITGTSPGNYITRLRINKAVSLLKEGDLNITEIALATGFNDTNYFSRLFKKYQKVAPSQIRKRL